MWRTWELASPVNKETLTERLTVAGPDKDSQSRQQLADLIEKVLVKYQSKLTAITSLQGMRITKGLLWDSWDKQHESAMGKCKEILAKLRELPKVFSEGEIRLTLAGESSASPDLVTQQVVDARFTQTQKEAEDQIQNELKNLYVELISIYATNYTVNKNRGTLGQSVTEACNRIVSSRTELDYAIVRILGLLKASNNALVHDAVKTAQFPASISVVVPDREKGKEKGATKEISVNVKSLLATLAEQDEKILARSEIMKEATRAGLTG
jgi:hypothetical protein